MRVPSHGVCLSRRGRRYRRLAAGLAVLLLSSSVRAGAQVDPPDVPVSSTTPVNFTPEERAWLDALDRILELVAASERR